MWVDVEIRLFYDSILQRVLKNEKKPKKMESIAETLLLIIDELGRLNL